MKFNMDIPPKKEEEKIEEGVENKENEEVFLTETVFSEQEEEEFLEVSGVISKRVNNQKFVECVDKFVEYVSDEVKLKKFTSYLFRKMSNSSLENIDFSYFWIKEIGSFAEIEATHFYDSKDRKENYFESVLNKMQNNKELNYLISLIIEVSLDNIKQIKEKGKKEDLKEIHLLPFKVSPNQYGFKDNDNLYILNDNFDKKTISELRELKKRENLFWESNDSVFEVNYLGEISAKQQEIVKYLYNNSRPISGEDVLISVEKKDGLDKKIKNFSKILDFEIISILEKDLKISFKELSIQKQFHFLEFLCNIKTVDFSNIKKFIKKYSYDGIKSFLSLESGGVGMSDKIITLGEKLPEDSAKVLFKTYSEMVDATENIYDFLRQNLKEDISFEMVQKIKESLLLDGQKMLEKYADKASVCEGVSCVELGRELSERLALAKESVFVFAYSCKALVEKGEFSFEDFEKVKLSYDQSPLPEKTKNQIIKMHQENTKQYPEKLKTFWRQTLKDGLEKENPKQMVVHVSYEDDVVSAMRVIEQEDGSWYGASFNINPTVQGSRIGSELLKKVLEDLAKDKPFIAECYAENPMLQTYLDKFGFKITKEIENYKDTGSKVYEITLSPKESL